MQQNDVSWTTRFDDKIHIKTDQPAIRITDICLGETILPTIGGTDDAKSDALVKLCDLTLHNTLHLVGSRPLSGAWQNHDEYGQRVLLQPLHSSIFSTESTEGLSL